MARTLVADCCNLNNCIRFIQLNFIMNIQTNLDAILSAQLYLQAFHNLELQNKMRIWYSVATFYLFNLLHASDI